MQLVISCFTPIEQLDRCQWHHSKDIDYFVSSAYYFLHLGELPRDTQDSSFERILTRVWISWDPYKVKVFYWKLLQDQIPTRVNLFNRGICSGLGDFHCHFCSGVIESSSHLFVTCEAVGSIWYRIFRWLGQVMVLPKDLGTFFICLVLMVVCLGL